MTKEEFKVEYQKRVEEYLNGCDPDTVCMVDIACSILAGLGLGPYLEIPLKDLDENEDFATLEQSFANVEGFDTPEHFSETVREIIGITLSVTE